MNTNIMEPWSVLHSLFFPGLLFPRPIRVNENKKKKFGQIYWRGILTGNTLFVTLGEEHESLGVALGGLQESFSVGVLSNALEDCTNSARDLLDSCSARLFSVFTALTGTNAYFE